MGGCAEMGGFAGESQAVYFWELNFARTLRVYLM